MAGLDYPCEYMAELDYSYIKQLASVIQMLDIAYHVCANPHYRTIILYVVSDRSVGVGMINFWNDSHYYTYPEGYFFT
jgi:hypothetical protein